MRHHTGAVGVCQKTDPVSAPPPPAAHRLAGRYGAAALSDGYVAIPRVVIRRRRALHITTSEWDYICEVWSYWRADRLPGPSVEELAAGLGVDQSTIRRRRASLERKGLLRVVSVGPYNRYDLRPLIDAAVGLERLHSTGDQEDALARRAADGPCRTPSNERAELHATKEVEKKLDYDSIPPHPLMHGDVVSAGEAMPGQTLVDPAVARAIAVLGNEFGDDTPHSSISRAENLRRDAAVSAKDFLILVAEAASRTRVRRDHILARGRDGGPGGIRYFFAVLTDVLHPPAPRLASRKGNACAASAAAPAGHRPVDHLGRGDERVKGQRAEGAYGHHPDPPSADIRREWRETLNALRVELTAENYRHWFVPTSVLSLDGNLLHIGVPDDFHRQWLDRRLRVVVERALGRVAPGVQVAFVVEDVVQNDRRGSQV